MLGYGGRFPSAGGSRRDDLGMQRQSQSRHHWAPTGEEL